VAPQIVHHTVPESAEPVERLIGQCLAVERDSEFVPSAPEYPSGIARLLVGPNIAEHYGRIDKITGEA